MPPEITAGPLALAGSPPGVAAGIKTAEPPPDSVLNANLFASLLAQSSPPEPPGGVAKATPILSAKVILNAKPGLNARLGLNAARPALKNLKTMDTLPNLSLHSQGAAKVKASELLSPHALAPNEPAHKTPTDDKPAPNSSSAPANAPDPAPATAALSAAAAALPPAPALVPMTAGQSPTLAAAAPSPMLSAAPAPQVTSLVPQVEAVTSASSKSVASALQPATPTPAMLPSGPVPLTETASAAIPAEQASAEHTPTPLSAFGPGEAQQASLTQPAGHPRANPLPLGLSLPRFSRPGLTQPGNLAPPQAKDSALPQAAGAVRQPAVSAPAAVLSAAPAAASRVLAAPFVSPAAGGLAPPAPALPKSAGKSAPASLKPAAENADTITRTLPVQTTRAAAEITKQAAAPVPVAEKSAAQQEAAQTVKTLDAKKTEEPDALLKSAATPVETQAFVPETQASRPSSKPLSAADHAAMVRQVADGVGAMPLPAKPSAAQQMSLQLHPKDWGSLQVSVSVTAGPDAGAAKTVTAHIVAETPQVKAALQSQMPALRQSLRASGLNLEHLTVSVKPAMETAKPQITEPASSGASSGFSPNGFSSGQEQASAGGSQPQTGPQTGQPSGASAFGSMASGGGSQNARQGQMPPAFAPAAAPAEPDEIVIERLPMRPVLGRIDTLA